MLHRRKWVDDDPWTIPECRCQNVAVRSVSGGLAGETGVGPVGVSVGREPDKRPTVLLSLRLGLPSRGEEVKRSRLVAWS